MPSLRELIISHCDKLEELEMGFPKLEELLLGDLKSLECLGASQFPMLKLLDVINCEKLKRLRGGWDKLKCLRQIRGDSREWWDAIQWDDDNIKTSLQSKYT
jgi:hypothetical protein